MNPKKIFLSEDDLVRSLKNNEPIGMQALYDMCSDSLRGIIACIIKNHDEQSDVLQEVMSRIWLSSSQYDQSRGRLFTWMLNIARNCSIDLVKSKAYRNTQRNVSIDEHVGIPNFYRQCAYNIDTIGVKDKLLFLQPNWISVMDLVYLKGYTHIQAAEKLDIPLGTLKTRVRMALIALKKYFN